MQHIKTKNKPYMFLAFKIKLLGKYVRKPPSKKVNKECFGGLKESKYFN